VNTPATVCGNSIGTSTARCTTPASSSSTPPGQLGTPISTPILICGNAALGTATASCDTTTTGSPTGPPTNPTNPPVNLTGPPATADSPSGVAALQLDASNSQPTSLATGALASTGTNLSTITALALLLSLSGLAMLTGTGTGRRNKRTDLR
jgi:hypothetical protein